MKKQASMKHVTSAASRKHAKNAKMIQKQNKMTDAMLSAILAVRYRQRHLYNKVRRALHSLQSATFFAPIEPMCCEKHAKEIINLLAAGRPDSAALVCYVHCGDVVRSHNSMTALVNYIQCFGAGNRSSREFSYAYHRQDDTRRFQRGHWSCLSWGHVLPDNVSATVDDSFAVANQVVTACRAIGLASLWRKDADCRVTVGLPRQPEVQ